MKTTSALYKTLRTAAGSKYEIKIVQGSREYGNEDLWSLKIFSALYTDDNQAPCVGGVNSSKCEMQLKGFSSGWPRIAEFSVSIRLVSADGTRQSEWLKMGTFYTDERSVDKYGNLSVVAYDAMLMTEQYWTDKIPSASLPANWPITSKAFCDMLAGEGLISVDSRTTLDNTVAFIGLDTASTVRDKLKDIAAVHGANWVITPENKLRLIPYANAVDGSAAIAGIAIAGITIIGDNSFDVAGSTDYAFLGMNVISFESGPVLPAISKVVLESESGNVSESGTGAGYSLKGTCDFATTDGPASLCLSKTNGYIYKPFSATGAILDPAAEAGDIVIIDGQSYQMMAIEWSLSSWPVANISAPYEEEVDHEYTIISKEAKTYRKAMQSTDDKLKDYPTAVEMHSAIEQSESSITQTVSATYVTIENYEAAIENLQDQIDGAIQSFSGPDVPTLNNYPAEDWTTTSEKQQHIGALFLVTSDSQSGQAGQYYRFEQSGNNFAWMLVEDSALAQALAAAAEAQATANQAIQDAADVGTEAAQAIAVAAAQAAVDATNKANQALAEAKAYAQQQLNDFVTGDYADEIASINGQLDRKIETYYQTTDPSTGWTTPEEHSGDLWYDMGSQLYKRWNGESWDEVTANPPDAVFDTLDGKAVVFYDQPEPPYNKGDLWVQGAGGDILRCNVVRGESETFSASDWVLASKYTDDSTLEAFISGKFSEAIAAIQTQMDQKAETYYQEHDPENTRDDRTGYSRWDARAGIAVAGVVIVGSTKELHEGDLWYRTTDDKTFYWNGTEWVEQQISTEVFNTINGKSQIFVAQPTQEQYYNIGDLWVNATYSGDGVSYSNDVLRCNTAKAAGADFSISHWGKASKYTDDSALETFLNGETVNLTEIRGQIDRKIETWYGSTNPASSWATSAVKAEHVGDLWYDTSLVNGKPVNITRRYAYNETSRTYSWEVQDAPKAVFDQIDTKRQIFVSQPTPPYEEGDLWTKATYSGSGVSYSNDLLRCKRSRATGSFTIGDWELASKYTDDTKANTVDTDLQAYKDTTNARLTTDESSISAKVEHTHGRTGTVTSFSWALTEDSHKWYANNNEVLSITASGLTVNGSGTFTGTITATGGYIGNGSNGFTISATAIYNGMTSFSDTQHNGIYIGTDGIALGGGKFKVDSYGNISASSATFDGNVYASNIQYGNVGGYFNGAGIAGGSISGGYAGGSYTGQLSSGVIDSLGFANAFNSATAFGTDSYPAYFTAGRLISMGNVYASEVELRSSASGEANTTLSNHYHTILVNDNGTVTFGMPYNASSPPSFNQADTRFYKAGVAAVHVTALEYNRVPGEETVTYDSATKTLNVSVKATLDNNNQNGNIRTVTSIPANLAYNAGQDYGADSITLSSITATACGNPSWSSEDNAWYAASILSMTGTTMRSNGAVSTRKDQNTAIDVTVPYNAGKNAGIRSVDISSITQASYSTSSDLSVSFDNGYVRYNNGNIQGRATISLSGRNISKTAFISMDGQRAYTAGVTQGESNITITSVARNGEATYQSGYKRYAVPVIATASNSHTGTATLYVSATEAWNAGETQGINSVTVNQPNASGAPTYNSDEVTYSQLITCSASNGASNSRTITINAGAAFSAGRTEGESSVTITDLHATSVAESLPSPSYDPYNRRYLSTVRISASLSNGGGDWTSTSVNVTDIYEAGWTSGEEYGIEHAPHNITYNNVLEGGKSVLYVWCGTSRVLRFYVVSGYIIFDENYWG